jgi:Flp pilus assembly protein CpaB
MKRKKQILLALAISGVLIALTLTAGMRRPNQEFASVVSIKTEVPAGMVILPEHLTMTRLPKELITTGYLTDIASVVGQSTDCTLYTGQLIDKRWLHQRSTGIVYPDAESDGRLYTLRLPAEHANGFWLAAGNIVDVHLIPKIKPAEEIPEILPGVRIASLIGTGKEQTAGTSSPVIAGSSSTGPTLICLNVNTAQARALAIAETMCTIKLVPVNEPAQTFLQTDRSRQVDADW